MVEHVETIKPRPYTVAGLLAHIGITRYMWEKYKQDENISPACDQIEMIISEQKFAGAAVGLFDKTIMVRDLGLVEKRQTDHSGGVTVISPAEITKPRESGT